MKRLTRYSEKTATRSKIYIFMCVSVERVFNNYHILTSARVISQLDPRGSLNTVWGRYVKNSLSGYSCVKTSSQYNLRERKVSTIKTSLLPFYLQPFSHEAVLFSCKTRPFPAITRDALKPSRFTFLSRL